MSASLLAHAVTGTAVVLGGTLALVLRKGSAPHRLAGRLFVIAMVSMGPVVALGAWRHPGSISPLGVVFVIFVVYLVLSAWSTISQPENRLGVLDYTAPVAALTIGAASLVLGLTMPGGIAEAAGEAAGEAPMEAYFFFSALAFVALLLDINHLRSGGLSGRHRIIRHVWRMNCAMFFATSSLFTGPGAIVFPEWIRGHDALIIPQLWVLALALYWIVRLLLRKTADSGQYSRY